MNCEIFRILYLRANTEIPCNCGSGEKVNLGWSSADSAWSVSSLFANDRYAHVAESFKANRMPWGEACQKCVFLKPNEPFRDGFAEKRLEKIHVEPSLACALRCPGCTRVAQAKTREGPTFLPVPVFRRVLASLREEGFENELFYFCGQGEPLSHPAIEDLIAACREFFPKTTVVVNTNGNYNFAKVFKRGIYPDKFIVSIDGVHQHSYEKYRINGDVETAFQFIRDATRIEAKPFAVEWKYILFTYNDSDEELIEAQMRAEQMGVDSLQFVVTHTPEKSQRFFADNVDQIPLVWHGAFPETTPHLYFKRPLPQPLTPNNLDLLPDSASLGKIHICFDEFRNWAGRVFLRGWCMDTGGGSPVSLDIKINGVEAGRANLGTRRDDVFQAYPHLGNRTTGFVATLPPVPADPTKPQVATVTAVFKAASGESFDFSVDYDLSQNGSEVFNVDCP